MRLVRLLHDDPHCRRRVDEDPLITLNDRKRDEAIDPLCGSVQRQPLVVTQRMPKRERPLRVGVDYQATPAGRVGKGGQMCLKVLLPAPPFRDAKVITFMDAAPNQPCYYFAAVVVNK
jgi:hypothetical protein